MIHPMILQSYKPQHTRSIQPTRTRHSSFPLLYMFFLYQCGRIHTKKHQTLPTTRIYGFFNAAPHALRRRDICSNDTAPQWTLRAEINKRHDDTTAICDRDAHHRITIIIDTLENATKQHSRYIYLAAASINYNNCVLLLFCCCAKN